MTSERFTEDHEWIRIDGDIGTVGITDHAQEQLGDVVFVELPEVGRKAAKGEAVAVVESVKAASDVFAPVTGEVTEVTGVSADSLQHRLIATSDGGWIEEDRPGIRLVAQVVARRGDVIQTGRQGPAACAGVEFLDDHPPAETGRTWPGWSSVTPVKGVCGATTVQKVKVSASPSGSSARGIPGAAAKSAFTSLANQSRPSCTHRCNGRTPSRSRAANTSLVSVSKMMKANIPFSQFRHSTPCLANNSTSTSVSPVVRCGMPCSRASST